MRHLANGDAINRRADRHARSRLSRLWSEIRMTIGSGFVDPDVPQYLDLLVQIPDASIIPPVLSPRNALPTSLDLFRLRPSPIEG